MKEKLKKIILFVKKEIVLCIALILGFGGLLFCRPGVEVIKEAIDLRVLVLLFCLMYVIQGFASVNLLDKLAGKMLSFCKNTRQMFFVLTYLVFFLSMAVTNDVALLTFVPISLIICSEADCSGNACCQFRFLCYTYGKSSEFVSVQFLQYADCCIFCDYTKNWYSVFFYLWFSGMFFYKKACINSC